MGKFCENCGREINEGADICLGCGKAIRKINVTRVSYEGKPVNKAGYCILAFLFGGIGIHKFYAGKVGSGLLYLFFCWTLIPGLLAFIDFIVGLCKNSDENGNIYFY